LPSSGGADSCALTAAEGGGKKKRNSARGLVSWPWSETNRSTRLSDIGGEERGFDADLKEKCSFHVIAETQSKEGSIKQNKKGGGKKIEACEKMALTLKKQIVTGKGEKKRDRGRNQASHF